MRAVMERWDALVLPRGISLFKVGSSAGVKGADGFGQIPVVAGLAQVQVLGVVVGKDPGEDRVLVQVVVGPA